MLTRQSIFVNRPHGTSQSKGFTLIELLVVIAIISLLVSILIPSLSRARELAKRALCASNQRSVIEAYLVYASEYDSCLPVGYYKYKQRNYVLYDSSAHLIIIGYLYKAKLITQPEVLYCPSEKDASRSFNTSSNSWPPGTGTTANNTWRSGYSVRPEVAWNTESDPCLGPFPNLISLSGPALISANSPHPHHVMVRHKTGVNVGNVDGSVRFVDSSLFEDIFDSWGAAAANNPLMDEVWDVFDER